MSVKIMGMVWDLDNKVIDREEKYVLLAYADHADHKGYNIYPAVSTIMQKTGYKERSIQLITKSLASKGFLVADGRGPKGTNKWRVPLDKEGVRITPANFAPPQEDVDWGADGTLQGGAVTNAPESSEVVHKPSNNILKDTCLEILQSVGFSVFGNNMQGWQNFKRRLERDDVTITGDKAKVIIRGLSEMYDQQFTVAEVWQELYGLSFKRGGLEVEFYA